MPVLPTDRRPACIGLASGTATNNGGTAGHRPDSTKLEEEPNMSLQRIALIFGIVFVIVGVLGWVPAVNPGGKLLGIFDVNAAHNVVHLATGVVAIIVGAMSEKASRVFFQVFGVIYGLVAALGFFYGDAVLLGIVANNAADSVLHVVIAVVALYLGFGMKPEAPAAV